MKNKFRILEKTENGTTKFVPQIMSPFWWWQSFAVWPDRHILKHQDANGYPVVGIITKHFDFSLKYTADSKEEAEAFIKEYIRQRDLDKLGEAYKERKKKIVKKFPIEIDE